MTKTCYSSIFTVKNSIIKNNKSGTGGAIKMIGGKNGENGNASGDSTTATANNDKANIKSQSNMKIAKRTTARTYSVAPLIATVIIPFGAVPTIIILGLVALGLAAYIVYIMLKTFLIKSDKPQEVAEVYDILHNAYVTDEEAAKAEEEIVTAIAAETSKKDSAVAKAEEDAQKRSAVILANLTFKPTKKDLSSEAREIFGDNATITERGNATKTNLPLADTLYNPNGISDKGASSSVCFAYIYQLKDDSIKIIVKLDKTYAEQQMEFHPSIARSKFPKGKGWYVFKIDGTFDSMDKVMKLISQAHQYVSLKDRI